jgi:hypothetical protein
MGQGRANGFAEAVLGGAGDAALSSLSSSPSPPAASSVGSTSAARPVLHKAVCLLLAWLVSLPAPLPSNLLQPTTVSQVQLHLCAGSVLGSLAVHARRPLMRECASLLRAHHSDKVAFEQCIRLLRVLLGENSNDWEFVAVDLGLGETFLSLMAATSRSSTTETVELHELVRRSHRPESAPLRWTLAGAAAAQAQLQAESSSSSSSSTATTSSSTTSSSSSSSSSSSTTSSSSSVRGRYEQMLGWQVPRVLTGITATGSFTPRFGPTPPSSPLVHCFYGSSVPTPCCVTADLHGAFAVQEITLVLRIKYQTQSTLSGLPSLMEVQTGDERFTRYFKLSQMRAKEGTNGTLRTYTLRVYAPLARSIKFVFHSPPLDSSDKATFCVQCVRVSALECSPIDSSLPESAQTALCELLDRMTRVPAVATHLAAAGAPTLLARLLPLTQSAQLGGVIRLLLARLARESAPVCDRLLALTLSASQPPEYSLVASAVCAVQDQRTGDRLLALRDFVFAELRASADDRTRRRALLPLVHALAFSMRAAANAGRPACVVDERQFLALCEWALHPSSNSAGAVLHCLLPLLAVLVNRHASRYSLLLSKLDLATARKGGDPLSAPRLLRLLSLLSCVSPKAGGLLFASPVFPALLRGYQRCIEVSHAEAGAPTHENSLLRSYLEVFYIVVQGAIGKVWLAEHAIESLMSDIAAPGPHQGLVSDVLCELANLNPGCQDKLAASLARLVDKEEKEGATGEVDSEQPVQKVDGSSNQKHSMAVVAVTSSSSFSSPSSSISSSSISSSISSSSFSSSSPATAPWVMNSDSANFIQRLFTMTQTVRVVASAPDGSSSLPAIGDDALERSAVSVRNSPAYVGRRNLLFEPGMKSVVNCTISPDRRHLSKSNQPGWSTAATNVAFRSGVHTFRVRVNSLTDEQYYIGLVGRQLADIQAGTPVPGQHPSVSLQSGKVFINYNPHSTTLPSKYRKLCAGDQITVWADLDNYVIKFCVHDRKQRLAYVVGPVSFAQIVPSRTVAFTPAVSLLKPGAAVLLQRATCQHSGVISSASWPPLYAGQLQKAHAPKAHAQKAHTLPGGVQLLGDEHPISCLYPTTVYKLLPNDTLAKLTAALLARDKVSPSQHQVHYFLGKQRLHPSSLCGALAAREEFSYSGLVDLRYEILSTQEAAQLSGSLPLLVSEPCTANCAVLERFMSGGGLLGLLRSIFGHVVGSVETADPHTLVWLRWLKQLQLQLQLPDYARAFVDANDCRKLLLTLLRHEEGPLSGERWRKKTQLESVASMGTRLFRPLFSSLSMCFERSGGAQANAVRELALRTGVVKGILASLGEIEKVSARVPESFQANDEISKRLHTLAKGKEPAAARRSSTGVLNINKSTTYWAAGTGYGFGSTHSNWSPDAYEKEKRSNAECSASIINMLAAFCSVASEDTQVVSFTEVHQLFGDSCLIPLLVR